MFGWLGWKYDMKSDQKVARFCPFQCMKRVLNQCWIHKRIGRIELSNANRVYIIKLKKARFLSCTIIGEHMEAMDQINFIRQFYVYFQVGSHLDDTQLGPGWYCSSFAWFFSYHINRIQSLNLCAADLAWQSMIGIENHQHCTLN